MKKNNLTGNDYSQEFLNEKQDVKKRITDRTGRLNTEAGTEATKNASGHLQLEGEAIMSLDKPRNALFVPTGAVLAGEIEPRRTYGTTMWHANGTLEFVEQDLRSHRSQATLIKKLPHGRLSETKNGNLQLTVIVSKAELEEPGAEICFSAEGCLAAEAAIVFMLRRRLAQDRKL